MSAADTHAFRTGTGLASSADESLLRQLSAGSDASFAAFAAAAAAALAAGSPSALTRHAYLSTACGARAPDAGAAVAALALDHARCGLPEGTAAAAWEEAGLPAARAAALAAALAPAAACARARLADAGPGALPRLVDLRWRLDYLVASRGGGRLGAPLYAVDLVLEEAAGGGRSTRSFTCTPPELEELRAKVKEALRAAAALATA